MRIQNEAALQQFGKRLADLLQPGDVLLLDGDLGAGKTSLTKGIAEGLGIDAPIKSPTFTIIREYQQGRLPLYHMDIYRLENGGADDLGLEEYFEGDGVSVVEWPEFLGQSLPEAYLMLHLVKDENDDDARHLSFDAVGERAQALLKQLDITEE
ncbi:tRNA (adenosine(37)-N6)-threonylcarbamoyltransferase complex ATPase subunit type 1 TsaE [Lacticaseibacillus saniviri]|uniref:tRNA threonylcarbamoyladenosine biosynthesis protein TsaE n=2 Tax=Lacticaseibacillus saniviri TaxID=931533 RepID=A0A0R2N0R3_9LACO|nr:tRNA (adenosine(37)-N6)-threonylcarbamoyltransferase complex ATPase subunit type 1 TsaE [Lacticaseibacillus saniviri]KRO16586.1 ATPase or kinase [Lacticaseibacillus saniviri JCM 17471 = DSM 24301]